jgi:hypothetical protein
MMTGTFYKGALDWLDDKGIFQMGTLDWLDNKGIFQKDCEFYCEDEDFLDQYVGDDCTRNNDERMFDLHSYGCDRL